MAAYYALVEVSVDDLETYKKYAAAAGPVVARHGGEYLVRGGTARLVEGDRELPQRVVVIRFPSEAAFEAFYNDPDYQAARDIRLPVSHMNWIGVEGYEA